MEEVGKVGIVLVRERREVMGEQSAISFQKLARSKKKKHNKGVKEWAWGSLEVRKWDIEKITRYRGEKYLTPPPSAVGGRQRRNQRKK
jgi:hypothetical protein